MANVPIVENFPKATFSRADVEAQRALRLEIPGAVSSIITEDASDWILTTVFPGGTASPASGAAPVSTAVQAPVPPPGELTPAAPADSLQSAIKTALRLNEIGNASPYQLSFAGKGKSGASFGFMQGDMAAGPQIVRDTFDRALAAAGMDATTIAGLARQLSIPLFHNPLGQADTQAVNAALNAPAGRQQVDAMDAQLCSGILRSVSTCVSTATAAGKRVDALAQIYMALWINMTGPPSTLLNWLSGQNVFLSRELEAPGLIVDGSEMEAYLRTTTYFSENPNNLPHTLQSAAAGANQLVA